MQVRKRRLAATRKDIEDGTRSSLFLFMVRHHGNLVAKGHDGRMPWTKLCKRFAADGLSDGHGPPPTPKRAGETWREACAEVNGSRGKPPNANSVRRVWNRVVTYLERRNDMRTTRARRKAGRVG